jgi:hypothetical protein
VREWCTRHGFRLVIEIGDGHCGFRWLARVIYGTAELHPWVRYNILEYMLDTREKWERMGVHERFPGGFDAWVEFMQHSGPAHTVNRYLNQWLLLAAAELYGRRIVVYDDDLTKPPTVYGDATHVEGRSNMVAHHEHRIHFNTFLELDRLACDELPGDSPPQPRSDWATLAPRAIKTPWWCACGQERDTRAQLQTHVQTCTRGQEALATCICGKVFITEREMQVHELHCTIVHPPVEGTEGLTTCVCGVQLDDAAEFEVHVRTCDTAREAARTSSVCACGRAFLTISRLLSHEDTCALKARLRARSAAEPESQAPTAADEAKTARQRTIESWNRRAESQRQARQQQQDDGVHVMRVSMPARPLPLVGVDRFPLRYADLVDEEVPPPFPRAYDPHDDAQFRERAPRAPPAKKVPPTVDRDVPTPPRRRVRGFIPELSRTFDELMGRPREEPIKRKRTEPPTRRVRPARNVTAQRFIVYDHGYCRAAWVRKGVSSADVASGVADPADYMLLERDTEMGVVAAALEALSSIGPQAVIMLRAWQRAYDCLLKAEERAELQDEFRQQYRATRDHGSDQQLGRERHTWSTALDTLRAAIAAAEEGQVEEPVVTPPARPLLPTPAARAPTRAEQRARFPQVVGRGLNRVVVEDVPLDAENDDCMEERASEATELDWASVDYDGGDVGVEPALMDVVLEHESRRARSYLWVCLTAWRGACQRSPQEKELARLKRRLARAQLVRDAPAAEVGAVAARVALEAAADTSLDPLSAPRPLPRWTTDFAGEACRHRRRQTPSLAHRLT